MSESLPHEGSQPDHEALAVGLAERAQRVGKIVQALGETPFAPSGSEGNESQISFQIPSKVQYQGKTMGGYTTTREGVDRLHTTTFARFERKPPLYSRNAVRLYTLIPEGTYEHHPDSMFDKGYPLPEVLLESAIPPDMGPFQRKQSSNLMTTCDVDANGVLTLRSNNRGYRATAPYGMRVIDVFTAKGVERTTVWYEKMKEVSRNSRAIAFISPVCDKESEQLVHELIPYENIPTKALSIVSDALGDMLTGLADIEAGQAAWSPLRDLSDGGGYDRGLLPRSS